MKKSDKVILCALAMSLSMNLASCGSKKVSAKSDIFDRHFETYVTTEIVDESLEKTYWANNIVIGINKETNEISRYLYFYGFANDYLYNNIIDPSVLTGEIVELFNLDTGELIFFHSYDNKDLNFGSNTLNNLIEENDFYFLSSFYEDIDIEYKPSYTKEEINDIAKKFIEKKQKIKRLELSSYL